MRSSQPDAPSRESATALSQPGRGPGSPVARTVDLTKTYGRGDAIVRALDGVQVQFGRGRLTAVMGPSGSGKSTLLHCMAGLDVPTSGSAFVADQEIGLLDDAGLTELRRDRIGFVFQSFNLVPTLTAPVEMSGGQQQRIACARALIRRPELIFADEPTGNLDSSSSAEVLRFLRRSVDEHGQSIVMVTHDPRGAAYADRVVFLADGKVAGELVSPAADAVLEQMMKLGK
jgi:putative ABC transport system ATP-binding protein